MHILFPGKYLSYPDHNKQIKVLTILCNICIEQFCLIKHFFTLIKIKVLHIEIQLNTKLNTPIKKDTKEDTNHK